jgi:hypothetical protein
VRDFPPQLRCELPDAAKSNVRNALQRCIWRQTRDANFPLAFSEKDEIPLTPREYRAFEKHREGPHAAVSSLRDNRALSRKPKLVVFRFDAVKQRWIDDHAAQNIAPGINIVQAAIASLD